VQQMTVIGKVIALLASKAKTGHPFPANTLSQRPVVSLSAKSALLRMTSLFFSPSILCNL
jgi:hypothetical protein